MLAQFGMPQDDAWPYLARLYRAGRIDRPVRGLYTPVTSVTSVTSQPAERDTRDGRDTPLDGDEGTTP